MNTITFAIISLIAATAAFAQNEQVDIEARYEGFDPSLFAEVHTGAKKPLPGGVLAAPRVTVKMGQTGVIEICREVVLPVTLNGKAPESPRGSITFAVTDAHGNATVDGRKTANCGVSLEASPEFKNGQIVLSGKSTVRHLQQPGPKQPLNAVSFTTRETYFSDVVIDGQTITIQVGDGRKDKAKITLKITLIPSDGTPIKVSSYRRYRSMPDRDTNLVRISHFMLPVESASESLDFLSHLTSDWINNARRIDAGRRVIYFTGICSSEANPSPDARLTVEGDVLVIDGDNLILTSHIICAQDGTGEITTDGKSKTLTLSRSDSIIRARVRRLMKPEETDHFVQTILRSLPPELQSR